MFPATAIAASLLVRKRPTSELAGAKVLPRHSHEETWEYEQRNKPAKDEGDCLILGKEHAGRYKFGPYRVCLTANQKKVLRPGKKLGCGVFACAYAQGAGGVVKFTRDAEDVAALIKAQPLGVVPKVYGTYKLKNDGTAINPTIGLKTPVYAMVVERLKPIPPEARADLDSTLSMITDVLAGYDDTDICDSGQIACETFKAARTLKDAGINWDDIHSGNIGLDKQGHVKVLDLGVTGTQLVKQPKVLADAQRRLKKRALRGL